MDFLIGDYAIDSRYSGKFGFYAPIYKIMGYLPSQCVVIDINHTSISYPSKEVVIKISPLFKEALNVSNRR